MEVGKCHLRTSHGDSGQNKAGRLCTYLAKEDLDMLDQRYLQREEKGSLRIDIVLFVIAGC